MRGSMSSRNAYPKEVRALVLGGGAQRGKCAAVLLDQPAQMVLHTGERRD